MALGNYRDVEITLNGKKINIGGFKRPGDDVSVFEELKTVHGAGAVVSLTGNYTNVFEQAGLNPQFYTSGKSVDVYDWYSTPLEQTTSIPPSAYDNVYASVLAAQDSGKKIAIHCGAGDGRTALASLKLRELLEEAYANNSIDFDSPQKKRIKYMCILAH